MNKAKKVGRNKGKQRPILKTQAGKWEHEEGNKKFEWRNKRTGKEELKEKLKRIKDRHE